MKHIHTWTSIPENPQTATKYFKETILWDHTFTRLLKCNRKCNMCVIYCERTLKLSLTLHNQFKQKKFKSYNNSIDELASGSDYVSDWKKKVDLEFASYLFKSEPGLVKSYFFSNIITHKCRFLVTRQKKYNFFVVNYIHTCALPKTEMRFFTVCFCTYDKGVLIFMATVVNISIKQKQWC